jgi:transcriptional regulator with XRE-family HTH domain
MAVLTERKVWRRTEAPVYQRRTRRAAQLNERQQANVLEALKVLRVRFGSWASLARAMGILKGAMSRVVTGESRPHAGHAVRAARVAGVSPEDILKGRLFHADMCPMCGTRGVIRG